MIYIIATNNNKCEIQPKIFNFLKTEIFNQPHISKYPYKIIYTPKHILESSLLEIDKINDIVLWHPSCAGHNLELLKKFNKSIVILLSKTILIQKISENNPINENMAINHSFLIMYIDEEFSDITNNDWKLVVSEDSYKIRLKQLQTLITLT